MLGVSAFMNGAQERRRLEEELRRQEVRVLYVTSSLTRSEVAGAAGASHLSWLPQEEEALQRARAEEEAVLVGKNEALRPEPLQGSKH